MFETKNKNKIIFLKIILLIWASSCNGPNSDMARKTGKISKDSGAMDEQDEDDGHSSAAATPEGYLGDLLKQADLIEGSSAASDFATLNFKIHAKRLAAGDLTLKGDKGEVIGHCLIFAAGDAPFTNEDIKDHAQVTLSPGRRILATRSNESRPKDCEASFKALMPERFNKDFFNLHVSIYGVKQGEN
jgi:hypothetical protein